MDISSSDNIVEMMGNYKLLTKRFDLHNTETKRMEKMIRSAENMIINKTKDLAKTIRTCNKSIMTKEEIKYLSDMEVNDNRTEVAPGITLPVIHVPDDSYIPNSHLYYNDATGKCGIKILGHLITGEIGEISEKRTHCIDSKLTYPLWQNAEWLYTRSPINKKNKRMRHLGSRSTLLKDIYVATKHEQIQRNKQLSHDLLVTLCVAKIHNDLY